MTEKEQAELLLAAAKEIAQANGMNLTEWAVAAGFPRQQVSRWMNGRSGISLENFLRICRAAGARIEIINLKGSKNLLAP